MRSDVTRLLGLWCALSACARPPPHAAVESRQNTFPPSTTPWGRHQAADVCFPTTAPVGWRFDGTHHYENPNGLDVSWAYVSDEFTALTVYVYPQSGDVPKKMSLEEAEARVAASVVEDVVWTEQWSVAGMFGEPGVLFGGVRQLPLTSLIPADRHAEIAQKLGLPSLDGVTKPVGTLVMVWSPAPWFVKVRMTWLTDRRAIEVMSDVVEWSAVPCSARRALGSEPLVDVPPEELPGQPR